MRQFKLMLSLMLCAALALSLCACSQSLAETSGAAEQSVSETPAPEPVSEISESQRQAALAAQQRFSLELLKKGFEETPDENLLYSPLSVSFALSMTADGARGKTRSEMETLLAGPENFAALDALLSGLMRDYESLGALSIANSLWLHEAYASEFCEDFLAHSRELYSASLYTEPFDISTVEKVNSWVSEKTEGRIEQIVDRFSSDTVLCLVNALALDAKWAEPYEAHQVREGIFRAASGEDQKALMMHSTEKLYLRDEKAQGIVKYYEDGRLAFAALLPDEGVTLEEYVASLDGETLAGLLKNPQEASVSCTLPKFEAEFSAELSDPLSALGMPTAFSTVEADFGGIAQMRDGSTLFISRVLHKTMIRVDELGTQGGAATAVILEKNGAVMNQLTLTFDRPFLYTVFDRETGLPVFLGTLSDIS